MPLHTTLRQLFSPDKTRLGRGGIVAVLLLMVVVAQFITGYVWSREPKPFDVVEHATGLAQQRRHELLTGYITTATLIHTIETLIDKSGGLITNDVLPPGVLMDNIPHWEAGALGQIRDMTLALRNDIGRAQSQALEDSDLVAAESLLRIDARSWMLPAAESEYHAGTEALYDYLDRLGQGAEFKVQADNLDDWLALVEKRLDNLTQRLAANVTRARLADVNAGANTHLATPWAKIDDVFYEARGSSWALLHLLKAVEIDFQDVLAQKNAQARVRDIIEELEAAQTPMWSPIVLNGSGFGLFANHSLVMLNYLNRARNGAEDLRLLLVQE